MEIKKTLEETKEKVMRWYHDNEAEIEKEAMKFGWYMIGATVGMALGHVHGKYRHGVTWAKFEDMTYEMMPEDIPYGGYVSPIGEMDNAPLFSLAPSEWVEKHEKLKQN